MKISEQIKRLGNGLIERTTIETEIDTKIKYFPIQDVFSSDIAGAFADAGIMICALSDKVCISLDTDLNGEYELWQTYWSNLYDSDNRLVVKDAECHRKEKYGAIQFSELYQKVCHPKDNASAELRTMRAMGQLIKNEKGFLELWEDKKIRVYILGWERGKNNIQIFPEIMTKDKTMEFCKRLKMSFSGDSKYPLALLVSLGEEDSPALTYFKANPQVLESILIENCDWMAKNVKLKRTVSKSAITNEVVVKCEFVFDNQPKEQNNG